MTTPVLHPCITRKQCLCILDCYIVLMNISLRSCLACRKWPQEFKYNLDAPKGHLPLTNCLRGTQLFKAILEHPAFDRPAQGEEGNAKPDWLKETETKMSF